MIKRLQESQVLREKNIEKKYGIEDVKIFAYICDKTLNIIGEIISSKIEKPFKMICTTYDKDGDPIEMFANDSYGSITVTYSIWPEEFFCGYPFRISCRMKKGKSMSFIKIIPQ